MKKILVSMFVFVLTLYLVGCDRNRSSLPVEMPEDFSFALTFDFDGYYDSKTGLLKNGYNYNLESECKTTLIFDENELKEIYEILKYGWVDKVPTEITVSKDLVDPSYNITITYTLLQTTKTITIFGASSIRLDEWTSSKALGEAYYKIVNHYIKSSEEFKSLPENQYLYD